jgi:hypothetical protein
MAFASIRRSCHVIYLPPPARHLPAFGFAENTQQDSTEMEAVTIAPTAGDTSMLAGGFIRLNGVLMIPAMIFAMGTEKKNTPLINDISAKIACFQS